jgi:hypothetical protein
MMPLDHAEYWAHNLRLAEPREELPPVKVVEEMKARLGTLNDAKGKQGQVRRRRRHAGAPLVRRI